MQVVFAASLRVPCLHLAAREAGRGGLHVAQNWSRCHHRRWDKWIVKDTQQSFMLLHNDTASVFKLYPSFNA